MPECTLIQFHPAKARAKATRGAADVASVPAGDVAVATAADLYGGVSI